MNQKGTLYTLKKPKTATLQKPKQQVQKQQKQPKKRPIQQKQVQQVQQVQQQEQIEQAQTQQTQQMQQMQLSYMRLREKYLVDYTTRLYKITFADRRALRALIENQLMKYANVTNLSLEQKIAKATQDAARIIFRQS